MKIYIDLVFFINFMFDMLLLLTVNIVLKRNISFKKILYGSIIGGLSIFLLFIRLNTITLFLFKIIITIVKIKKPVVLQIKNVRIIGKMQHVQCQKHVQNVEQRKVKH